MDTINELLGLRQRMQADFKCFPHECCRESARRGRLELGLEETYGQFIDDNGLGNNHHWNKKDGFIIDITADQFCASLPPVYIIPENSPEAQARYYEGVYLML